MLERNTLFRLLDAVLVLLLAGYVLAGTQITPFHGDESMFIAMSEDYAYTFTERDLSRVRFSETPVDPRMQYLRLLNGTVHKYTTGAAWDIAGYELNDLNELWVWEEDWDYNVTNNNLPSDGLLAASRWASSLFTAATVGLVFVLGWQIGKRPTAYLAALYFALSPAVLVNGRRAMQEGSMLFFGLLTVLAAVWLLQRRAWWTVGLFGVAAGLGIASKHTNLLVFLSVIIACALYPAIAQRNNPGFYLRRHAAQLGVVGVLGLVTFLAVSPVWWGGNPLLKGLFVLGLRQDLIRGQVELFGGYENLLDALGGFWQQVMVARPQFYEAPDFAVYIADEMATYTRSFWSGVPIGGSTLGAVILLALLAVGLWRFARAKNIHAGTRIVVGAWSAVMLLVVVFLTPLEWQRYYLPIFPAVGLFAALGLSTLGTWLYDTIRRTQAQPA